MLLLTSTMGFVSYSCHVKLLVSMLVALAFLVIFLFARGRVAHTVMVFCNHASPPRCAGKPGEVDQGKRLG